jgi:glycosyltransferase involved in cell wall biosynthesis
MSLTLIVEPNPSGHRFTSVRYVAKLAGRRGDVVLLSCVGAGEREEFAVQLAESGVEVVEHFATFSPDGRALAEAVGAFCRSRPADVVVLMDADKALKSWWWHARREFRALPHRPRVRCFLTHYPARLRSARPRPWATRVAKAALVTLAMCTRTIERAVGFAGRDEPPGGLVVLRALDPAVCSAHSRDRVRIRKELGLPDERRLVGIFGGINPRKNPQMVFDAVLALDDETGLVLAGPVVAEVTAWVDSLSTELRGRLYVADGFLPNETLDEYLAAVDVVALLMTLEGPSGIQGKALAAGVPVVSAGSRTRARELAAFHSGVDTAWSAAGVAEGLRRILAEPDAFAAETGALPSTEQFARSILGEDPRDVDGR